MKMAINIKGMDTNVDVSFHSYWHTLTHTHTNFHASLNPYVSCFYCFIIHSLLEKMEM